MKHLHRNIWFPTVPAMTQEQIDHFDVHAPFKKKLNGLKYKWRFLRNDEIVEEGDRQILSEPPYHMEDDNGNIVEVKKEDTDGSYRARFRESDMMRIIFHVENINNFNFVHDMIGCKASSNPVRLFLRRVA